MRSRIETVLLVLGSLFPSKALEDRSLGSGQFGRQDHDYMGRGVIAKGVTSVCRARCVSFSPYIVDKISFSLSSYESQDYETLNVLKFM